MRSFILKTAIAAAFVTTSLSLGYAASGQTPHGIVDDTIDTHHGFVHDTTIDTQHGFVHEEQGEADVVPPVTLYPHAMTATARVMGTRLATIESELGRAAHRIAVDRHRGELTTREARIVRNEEGAIRAAAMRVAKRHDGRIPNASFVMLQDRVSDLNRRITHFARA
jgi:hypothetical protein